MHWIAGSVALEADVDRLFSEATQRYGRVDILVNNAALYPKIGFLESSSRDWAQVIETNVLGIGPVLPQGPARNARARPWPDRQHRQLCLARADPRRLRVLSVEGRGPGAHQGACRRDRPRSATRM